MAHTEKFEGRIKVTSGDERSAVVTLDEPIFGKNLAVISPSTKGRVKAMNGVGGLKADTRVSGRVVDGVDAAKVLEFEVIRN